MNVLRLCGTEGSRGHEARAASSRACGYHIMVLVVFAAGTVFGTPTGLNNIPTADTVPHRTVAVQYFSSFGGANQFATSGPGKTSDWAGFKTGWDFKPLHVGAWTVRWASWSTAARGGRGRTGTSGCTR
mgnify:CR=1 FL=1